jgi:hypothetical protein
LTWRLAGPGRLPRQALTAAAATTAVAAGLAVEWAAGGLAVGLGGLAVLVAAANGFAKAYSP